MIDDGLKSDKQRMFVQEYLIDLNATQAAIRAGYSEKTAKEIGCENLSKPNIQAAIQAAKEKRVKRLELSQDRTLLEYARLAYSDPRKFFKDDGSLIPIQDLDDDAAACIGGIDIQEHWEGKGEDAQLVKTKKIKIIDKLGALRDVGKHQGIFEKDNAQKSKDAVLAVLAMLPDVIREQIKSEVLKKLNG